MRRQIVIFISIIGSILALIFYLSYNSSPKYSWQDHYYNNSDDPYGTSFIHTLLDEYYTADQFREIKGSLLSELDTNDHAYNYVFIGDEFYATTIEQEFLFDRIKDGATALISANRFDSECWPILNECQMSELYWDTSAVFTLTDSQKVDIKKFPIKSYYENTTNYTNWTFLNLHDTCSPTYPYEILGRESESELINFMSIEYGKGQLLLHTSPIVFSNINLKEESFKTYSELVFSYLPEQRTYWDEYHKIYRGEYFGGQKLSGPLQYILSQKSFKWAWYLLLLTALVYIIFKSKREQKVIPVIQEKKNTSLEFVKTIGKLYQLENNHKKIVKRKMDLFLTFIRERFKISTASVDENLIELIAIRSGVTKTYINNIFDHYFKIVQSNKVSDKDLLVFDASIRQFYTDLNK